MKHADLLPVVRRLPEDYPPWGSQSREDGPGGWLFDCSSGCRYAVKLEGELGNDWVVCGNPSSHRAGLFTFEHQGYAVQR